MIGQTPFFCGFILLRRQGANAVAKCVTYCVAVSVAGGKVYIVTIGLADKLTLAQRNDPRLTVLGGYLYILGVSTCRETGADVNGSIQHQLNFFIPAGIRFSFNCKQHLVKLYFQAELYNRNREAITITDSNCIVLTDRQDTIQKMTELYRNSSNYPSAFELRIRSEQLLLEALQVDNTDRPIINYSSLIKKCCNTLIKIRESMPPPPFWLKNYTHPLLFSARSLEKKWSRPSPPCAIEKKIRFNTQKIHIHLCVLAQMYVDFLFILFFRCRRTDQDDFPW